MPAPIRIATYNTKNFFHSKHPHHPKKPREVRELARMVSKIDAHVLGLQEIEGNTSLNELNARLDSGYPHIESTQGNSYRGIHVGFMARSALQIKSHRGYALQDETGHCLDEYANETEAEQGQSGPARLQRDLVLAECEYQGQAVAIFNTHLKSRIQYEWQKNDSETLRKAEARAVHTIVSSYEQRNPQTAIILLGDFNHRFDDESLQPIFELGYFDPVQSELVPDNIQLSTHWSKPRDRIDYILLSKIAQQHYIAGSAVVHREAGARKASDHYPVSLALQF